MVDLLIGLYLLLLIGLQIMIYRKHCLKPRYRPLKEAGLLTEHISLHLLHAVFRRKGDPLRRLQLELGVYGLMHMVVIIVLFLTGAGFINYLWIGTWD